MQLHEEPSKRIPRTIQPRMHSEVWRLHSDGLNPRQISEQLAASGCHASRFAVRRLVIQLTRIQARQEHAKKMTEELKLTRASALALREAHEEQLSDVCDDLFIAARKDRHEQVLSLARTGRLLFREVARYGRLYEDALKQASMLPGPAQETPEAVKMPLAPAQTRTTGFDAPRDRPVLELTKTAIKAVAQASRLLPQGSLGHRPLQKTPLTPLRQQAGRLRYGFDCRPVLVAIILFLLPNLSCRALVLDPDDFVKMPLAPAQTRTTRFDAPRDRPVLELTQGAWIAPPSVVGLTARRLLPSPSTGRAALGIRNSLLPPRLRRLAFAPRVWNQGSRSLRHRLISDAHCGPSRTRGGQKSAGGQPDD